MSCRSSTRWALSLGAQCGGVLNARPYHNRGWCCAEFAIALYNKRIVNLGDADVQTVLRSREWPSGGIVEACRMYGEMMGSSNDVTDTGVDGLTYDPGKGVSFTSKGDRQAVKYNFFKMTMVKKGLGL